MGGKLHRNVFVIIFVVAFCIVAKEIANNQQ